MTGQASMKKQDGFTLAELMVVIAVLGVLVATAVPCYRTIQRRACGSEATMMIKQVLDAEIMYFLEHDKFFPEVGQTLTIFHNDLPSKPEIDQIKGALNIDIPTGHNLDFTITTMPGQTSMITISSFSNSFPLFKNGASSITGTLDSTGKVDIF
jgi:prepilin-type N-terminal cleavage/methylation domain-containing protein